VFAEAEREEEINVGQETQSTNQHTGTCLTKANALGQAKAPLVPRSAFACR